MITGGRLFMIILVNMAVKDELDMLVVILNHITTSLAGMT